jgi:hypothetical protein
VCDFLLRLNGYARTAQIQYEKGGADAADNVEHFLLNCGDDDLLDPIYPQRLDDIQRVEKIISYQFLGEEQKKQRDRVKTGHGLSLHKKERRDSRRKDRDDGTRRSKPRRKSRFYERPSSRPDRWHDRRSGDDRQERASWSDNRDYDYGRLVALSASTEDLRAALDERRVSRNTNLYDSSSDGSAQKYQSDYDSDSDSDWMEAGADVSQHRNPNGRQEHQRNNMPPVKRSDKTNSRHVRTYRRDRTDSSRERRMTDRAGRVAQQGMTIISADVDASSANRCMTLAGASCLRGLRSYPSSSRLQWTNQR